MRGALPSLAVRVFEHNLALEDTIGSYTCSIEALAGM
jgi:hypothetical protein